VKKAGIISLGCPRNLVDSEVILGSLKKEGFTISQIGEGVDIGIVNTCSFIDSAKEESIDMILAAADLKKEGKIKYLVISGCLAQLAEKELREKIPEADLIVGTSDFPKIARAVKNLSPGKVRSMVSGQLTYIYDEASPRILLTPRHYAYVKVSEGCSNFCSYCIISSLRGIFRSRAIESVIEEVKALAKGGALKEINLIGQDTTLFGMDRYGQVRFPELLRKICGLENSVEWVRILYTHPAHYTDELISTVSDEEKICKYLDLPVQHISDRILKKMNRHTTKKDIMTLVSDLRKRIKGLVLRTSLIVGFPGETDRDFKELLDFLRDMRFEKVGAFIYSREKGTAAADFKNQIPEKIKDERFDEVMKLQKDISGSINKSFLGRVIKVLVDEKVEDERDKFLARSYGDAPEVDGVIYLTGRNIKVGEFYHAKITDTLEYDLVGERI